MALLLTARRISKRFGGSVALSDVDLELREAEILGLIGPNGAGKTTLINILSGTLRASSGEVRFQDRAIDGWAAHEIARLGVARTFQLVRPFMGMTVEENIVVGALFGRARGHRDRRGRGQRVEEILTFLGLERRRADPVRVLNIPDRKRVELGRALAMEPSVLLLDELVAGLNPTEVESLLEVVRAIHRQGVSLVIVEHVMRAVFGLCDRVMVLHHGRKIADGPTELVLNDPQVVEAYLGRSFVDRFSSGGEWGSRGNHGP